MRPSDRTGFQIVIICALRVELDAVEAVFDEFWDEDEDRFHYGKGPRDDNVYLFGRINHHPVVLAYMPGLGKQSSATVAANCLTSFPNIQLGLVVGVCGGVPQAGGKDIFLGDIIISTGVIQFDSGVQFDGQLVARSDTLEDNLGRPNREIRSFLHQLQCWRSRTKLQQRVSTYISEICEKDNFDSWRCPPLEDDKLYEAQYCHQKHGEMQKEAIYLSCNQLQCDAHELICRQRTNAQTPEIHFGRIASGDRVMKSGIHRDKIARETNVLAFEMEGAGVWDNFPTIIIKGVCDYADSHKNKDWQKYASVTAAASVKAVLREWQGVDGPVPGGLLTKGTDMNRNVIFTNYGNVVNQGVTQTFHGSVTF
ncbi:nucleoside phosphorylase domain-containing protein [Aspergillus cavernicola]|uniref:Nucleoside phosphorylase domain-containing protein n=1 Tax=Aspergillus cavernicola TaxID=176166 RepID=A0ABR4HMB2_9EURO